MVGYKTTSRRSASTTRWMLHPFEIAKFSHTTHQFQVLSPPKHGGCSKWISLLYQVCVCAAISVVSGNRSELGQTGESVAKPLAPILQYSPMRCIHHCLCFAVSVASGNRSRRHDEVYRQRRCKVADRRGGHQEAGGLLGALTRESCRHVSKTAEYASFSWLAGLMTRPTMPLNGSGSESGSGSGSI